MSDWVAEDVSLAGFVTDLETVVDAMATLFRVGWGQSKPAIRQLMTTTMAPDANREEQDWFNDVQRLSASPENAVRIDGA